MRLSHRLLFVFLSGQKVQMILNRLQRKVKFFYLKMLQAIRLGFLALILFFFALQFIALAFIGFGITVIFLWPDIELTNKLYAILLFFFVTFLVSILALRLIFSERFWFYFSRILKIINM